LSSSLTEVVHRRTLAPRSTPRSLATGERLVYPLVGTRNERLAYPLAGTRNERLAYPLAGTRGSAHDEHQDTQRDENAARGRRNDATDPDCIINPACDCLESAAGRGDAQRHRSRKERRGYRLSKEHRAETGQKQENACNAKSDSVTMAQFPAPRLAIRHA